MRALSTFLVVANSIALMSIDEVVAPASAGDKFTPLAGVRGAELYYENLGMSYAWGLSGDGKVSAGQLATDTGSIEAAYFKSNGKGQTLGFLPGDAASIGWAVSQDGLTVVGESDGGPQGFQAFRWTKKSGMQPLDTSTDEFDSSAALAVSANGSVIVGYGDGISGRQAFRWTMTEGLVGLGRLNGGSGFSTARGVSGDGVIIVGESGDFNVEDFSGLQAFRWTQSTGMVGLGLLPSFGSSAADAVSADGSTIVGHAFSRTGGEAFRWTQETGMMGLGALSTSGFSYSQPFAVNSNGTVVVGVSTSARNSDGAEAVIWFGNSGIVSLSSLFTERGLSIDGWQLIGATGVNAAGTIVSGYGRNPAGLVQGWVANLKKGLVGKNELAQSLSTLGQISSQASQSTSSGLGAAFASNLNSPCSDNETEVCTTGSRSETAFDETSDQPQYAETSTVYALSSSLKMGTRVRYNSSTSFVDAHGGRSNIESTSVSAFGSWQPADDELQVFGSALLQRLQLRTGRGYVSGGDEEVVSEGSRRGVGYGAGLGVGRVFDWATGSIMPYARYEHTKLELDAYSEDGGPFPAQYYALESALDVARIGVDGRFDLGSRVGLSASASLAHRISGGYADVSGRLIDFDSDFTIPSSALKDSWAEVSLGLSYQDDDLSLRMYAAGSNAQTTLTSSANIEAGWKF
jgi:probable HAF family extracellular repeat protein